MYQPEDAYQKVGLDSHEQLLLSHIACNASMVHGGQGMAHCSRLSQFAGPVDSASLQGCKGSRCHWQHAMKIGLHSTMTRDFEDIQQISRERVEGRGQHWTFW